MKDYQIGGIIYILCVASWGIVFFVSWGFDIMKRITKRQQRNKI